MAESHIVSALVRKRTEVAGRLLEAERQMAGIHDDLAHLDAVMRMFASDLDPSTIKSRKARTGPHIFAKGGMARLILDMLRDAPEPMTAKDMAKLILTAKGEDAGEPKRVEAVIQRVLGTLGGTRLRGWWRAETFQCIVTDTGKIPTQSQWLKPLPNSTKRIPTQLTWRTPPKPTPTVDFLDTTVHEQHVCMLFNNARSMRH